MSHHRVLILDSGIGGMSVTQKIRARMPNAQIAYIADSAAFPYGNKSALEMQQRLQYLLEVEIPNFQPDLGVIACNSASTAVLGSLRESCSIPLVGVVPAIKPAAKISRSKSIGVLATAHTAKSDYTKSLIKQYAADCEVTVYGAHNLAQLAEEKYRGVKLEPARIKEELEILTEQKKLHRMDTVVLACTHFPLLLNELRVAVPHIDYWVDSGNAIAKRVEHCLSNIPFNNLTKTKQEPNLFLTTSSNACYSDRMLTSSLGNHIKNELLAPYHALK